MKVRTVLGVGLGVLLGLCLGAGVGIVSGHTAAKLAEPDPLGPTALPAIPDKVPTGADAYVPGLTVSLISKDFLQRAKWTCKTQATEKNLSLPAAHRTSCDAPEGARLSVTLWHDSETKVKSVEADCRYPLGSELCRTLARGIAELSVVGRPDVAKRTAAWAVDNVDRDATTVIGDVRLISDLSSRHPSMRILPAA
ncbi:hypothetical protein AB0J80_04875 [Actinoplanes sp. NPDC049548]|uniref:hypothetical protein n=1 Tax=Actinoplanes sp. NPDC049548 TaxID=3155152 RepID=UPI00343DA348